MFNEFKKFLSRGNAIDLAIGIIIGAAFTKIVTSLADDIITPVLSLIPSTSLGGLHIDALGVKIRFGGFLANIINFVVTGFALFLLVKAMNKLNLRKEVVPKKKCPYCKCEIDREAVKCAFCASDIADPVDTTEDKDKQGAR